MVDKHKHIACYALDSKFSSVDLWSFNCPFEEYKCIIMNTLSLLDTRERYVAFVIQR